MQPSVTNNSPTPIADIRSSVQKQHRREVWQQIILPCLIFSALIIAVGVLAAVGGGGNASLAASMAIIFLIIPLSVFLLTILIILGIFVFGVTKLMDWLPQSMTVVQNFFAMITYQSRRYCDKSVAPILYIAGWNEAAHMAGRVTVRMFSAAAHVPSSHPKTNA